MKPISDAELEARIFGGPIASENDVQALKAQADILLEPQSPMTTYELEYTTGDGIVLLCVCQDIEDDEAVTSVSYNIYGEETHEPYLYESYVLSRPDRTVTSSYGQRTTEENGQLGEAVVDRILKSTPGLSAKEQAIFRQLGKFCRALQEDYDTPQANTDDEKFPFPDLLHDVTIEQAENKEIIREASAVIGSLTVTIQSCHYEPPIEDMEVAANALPRLNLLVADESDASYFALFLQDGSAHSGVLSAKDVAENADYLDPTMDEDDVLNKKHSKSVIDKLSDALVEFAVQESDLL